MHPILSDGTYLIEQSSNEGMFIVSNRITHDSQIVYIDACSGELDTETELPTYVHQAVKDYLHNTE